MCVDMSPSISRYAGPFIVIGKPIFETLRFAYVDRAPPIWGNLLCEDVISPLVNPR